MAAAQLGYDCHILDPHDSPAAARVAAKFTRAKFDDAEALKQTGKELHAGLSGTLRMGLSSGPGALLSTPLMLRRHSCGQSRIFFRSPSSVRMSSTSS